MAEPASEILGRELVLASAGSGKTYQLSSRLIGLLAVGVPPEEILASTFTRKAAGEILERVLLRLAKGALSAEAAAELAESMPVGVPRDRLSAEGCGEILARTVRALHRLQVHTLDAFFHRTVRAFSLELGLPGGWGVADEPTGLRLRARALEAALREGDRDVLVELVRLTGLGDADRSVHRLLLERVTELHGAYWELSPDAEDPWGEELLATEERRPAGEAGDPAAVERAIRSLVAVELPTTKAGAPRRNWVANVERIVAAATDRDWGALLDVSLVKRVVSGRLEFDRAAIDPDVCGPIEALLGAAVAELRPLLRRRVRALGRFLPEYDARLRRLQREEGLYGFSDLTRVLLGAGPLGAGRRGAGPLGVGAELHYRLDGRIRHVLLDEFQDTSTAQWAALEPLVGEILSGYEGERAAFIVADPKQSIYGWRDGEPRILDRIRGQYGLEPSTLAKSWRSSPVVLDIVNRVFRDPHSNPVVVDDERIRDIARRWADGFEEHAAEHLELPGHVSVEVGSEPEGAERGISGEPLLHRTAARVAELHRRIPGASIGILTRRNVTVAGLIAELRELGIEASEEGGVPVVDSAAVVAVLALLRVADHAGDSISRYLVAHSPLGVVVGLEDWRSESHAADVGRRIRARLILEGYGPVLSDWARRIDHALAPRDRRRLRALVEMAHKWEDRNTLRPTDFVRVAEATRVEDGAGEGSPGVRIMTIYRSKGLEFDVVVLPELDGLSLACGPLPPFLAERESGGAGPVRRILPGVKSDWEPLFPELETAAAQYRESAGRDALSAIYVALTRARFAVHVLMDPDGDGKSTARSAARFLREALRPGEPAPADELFWSEGDPEWWKRPAAPKRLEQTGPGAPPEVAAAGNGAPTRLRLADSPRRRLLRRRSPSEMEGGERVSLGSALRPIPPGALQRGSLVHAWLETIEWLEEDSGVDRQRSPAPGPTGLLPGLDRERCLRIAREREPGVRNPEGLLDELGRWIEAPAVRSLLSREAFPEGTRVERELPFLCRASDHVVQGVADRVFRIPAPEGIRLLVVDWKTDRIAAGDREELRRRIAYYRPQLEAYCDALAGLEGLPRDRVQGSLVMLEAGAVEQV